MNRKLFFLLIFAAILGTIIPFIYRYQKVLALNNSFAPKESLYRRNLPSDWLVGVVTDIGPSAQFETRYGTQFEDLQIGATVSLGEDLKTGPQDESTIAVKFNNFAQFALASNTRLNFTNTSSENFLINLNRGSTLDFESLANTTQFSLTSLHLLSQFTSAIGSINIENNLITINLTQGSVKLGYNDADVITQITEISTPKKIIFNDNTRTLKLKKL